MTDQSEERADPQSKWMDRRVFVTTLTGGFAGSFAGCSGDTGSTGSDQRSKNTTSPDGDGSSEEIKSVKRDIEDIYDLIRSLPVAADGEFVYDVKASTDKTDLQEMSEEARNTFETAENIDTDTEISKESQDHLTHVARVAFLLVDQRYLIHKTIVGGLVFRRAFSDGKYEHAKKLADESLEALEILIANGGKLEEEIESYRASDLDIDKVKRKTIRNDLNALLDVINWSVPAFEGFKSTAAGMVAIEDGNPDLEAERYGSAQEHYARAREHFARAEAAFDTAQGRGQSIEEMRSIVAGLRCFVPSLHSGYDELVKAFSELESGDEEEGLEMARKTYQDMEAEFSRCL